MIDLHYEHYDAFLFDFDGTLALTNPVHKAARLEAYETMAAALDDDRYITISAEIHAEAFRHGQTSLQINAWVLKQAGITPEIDLVAAQEIVDVKNQIYWAQAKQGLPEIEGATDYLKALSEVAPDKLGIITSGYRDSEVIPFLVRYGLDEVIPTDKIVASGDTPENKPHPAPYQLGLHRMRASAKHSMAVEDNANGIQSAKAAGLTVVGLAGTHTSLELRKHKSRQRPHVTVEGYNHLRARTGILHQAS